jgi:hypothetical protein
VGGYGATIDSLCNDVFAGALLARREETATLQWAATLQWPPRVAVAEGHCVQVGLSSDGSLHYHWLGQGLPPKRRLTPRCQT